MASTIFKLTIFWFSLVLALNFCCVLCQFWFAEAYGRFMEAYERFTEAYGRFTEAHGRFMETYGRFAAAYRRFREVHGRFTEAYGLRKVYRLTGGFGGSWKVGGLQKVYGVGRFTELGRFQRFMGSEAYGSYRGLWKVYGGLRNVY